jgi:hypothetical protein
MAKYTKIFKTIPLKGKRLIRDAQTLKKLVVMADGSLVSVGDVVKQAGWDTSEVEADILLADTGKSGIIAIDFDGPDGEHYFHHALSLDPDCKYVARGIGKGGGHLIYKAGNTEMLDKIISSDNGCNITSMDLQRGRKLIFLATPANETKELLTEPLQSYDELTYMPEIIQLYISTIYLQQAVATSEPHSAANDSTHRDSKLYYIVKDAIDNPDRYNHRFFNIVTTKEYKDILSKNQKHLDYPLIPDNLPMEASAQMYLTSIATILGRDPSIDADSFSRALHYVNSLFSSPKPDSEVNSIIKYITSGNSKINGEPVWQYNPEWSKTGLVYIDHDGSSHEVFMYTDRGQNFYLDHNHITNDIETYNSAGALVDNIKAVSKAAINKEKVLNRVLKVKIVNDPIRSFGIHRNEYGSEFNIYRWSEEQEILRNPELHKNNYNYPETTLRFLENSMGRDKLYDFFLPFIKRKFTTYDFSPLVLVLYGPPHSGKSAIPEGILAPLTNGRYINLGAEVATEKYNDWMLNKDIVFMDEIHHNRHDVLEKLINVINRSPKKLTGIRAMNVSASSVAYDNRITYIAACNSVTPLATESGDRRLVILRSRLPVSKALGLPNNVIEKNIVREAKDFAYFLATEVKPLEHALYIHNGWLKDADYKEYMQGSLDFNKALTTAIVNEDWVNFENTLLDKHISLDDINRSTHWNKDKGEIQVRLINSSESEAHYPALLNVGNVDMKKLMKELRECHSPNIMIRRDDRKDGVKASNKKTVAVFRWDDLTEEFKALLESDTASIAPIMED